VTKSDLAAGETAAPACYSRENAEGAEMPPLLSHWKYQWRRHRSEGEITVPWTHTKKISSWN